jgi:hypothetical protein
MGCLAVTHDELTCDHLPFNQRCGYCQRMELSPPQRKLLEVAVKRGRQGIVPQGTDLRVARRLIKGELLASANGIGRRFVITRAGEQLLWPEDPTPPNGRGAYGR